MIPDQPEIWFEALTAVGESIDWMWDSGKLWMALVFIAHLVVGARIKGRGVVTAV
jgi:hypothetical protein